MIKEKKNNLRKEMNDERKSLLKEDKEKWNSEIFENIVYMEEYIRAKDILCYVSTDSEVDTKRFLEFSLSQNKNVFVPKVLSKERMDFFKITSLSELEEGYFGIYEPDIKNEKFQKDSAFCVVPGLCFDKSGNRLGYGGGFYDRYLYEKKIIKVSLSYSSFVKEAIDCEEYDVKMDYIVTQHGVLNCKTLQQEDSKWKTGRKKHQNPKA